MRFIGQHHIMNQLKFILPDLYSHPERGVNILLRGPSGYGKTTMALEICRYLSGDSFEIYLADWSKYRFRKRVIFIDEVHKISNFEQLFHLMDSKEHVLVFATNQDGELPEAFSNRCFEFIFDDYNNDELILIARETSTFLANDEDFLEIVNASNRNPRILKSICSRLSTFFSVNNISSTKEVDFRNILSDLFSITDGLDTHCKRYLEILESVGGSCSLTTIKSLLHVDEKTIKESIEPVLLRKGKIKISQRGRTLL